MILLILGVALWAGAHFFKRLMPEKRAEMGDKGKGLVAIATFASVALMIIGYRMAPVIDLWSPPAFLRYVNNLLVLLAFYMFAVAGHGVWADRKIRHSMLTGIKLWAFAHLLVNGDLASVILFGGLLAWGVAQMIMINKAQPEWTPPAPAVKRKEYTFAIASIVVFGIAGWIHGWLGYYPFAG